MANPLVNNTLIVLIVICFKNVLASAASTPADKFFTDPSRENGDFLFHLAD